MPRFNAYHALLSVKKSDSEGLDSLINRVDKQIRVIKSLSPSSFTLDDLYDELAVMNMSYSEVGGNNIASCHQ